MTKCVLITALLLSFFYLKAYPQTDKPAAVEKVKQAVVLEDQNQFDAALDVLADAQKIDPHYINIPYEMTYCYYKLEQYQRVIDILTKLKDRPDSFDKLYELLGNSYQVLGQSPRAIAVYEEGLKRFPNSGVLYMEHGIVPLEAKDYYEAVKYFEKGIEVEPGFPSNYYWAATIYCNSDDPMWGLLYGEIFMNLERNTERTQTMGKLLYDTYKSNIRFDENGKATLTLSKVAVVDPKTIIKTPYNLIYEPTMGLSAITERNADINSLDRIRQNFLKFYYEKGFDKKYPNALFAYQQEIQRSGNMEAYDHWLLRNGDETMFNAWRTAKPVEWDKFIKWYSANLLKMDADNRWYRLQY